MFSYSLLVNIIGSTVLYAACWSVEFLKVIFFKYLSTLYNTTHFEKYVHNQAIKLSF
jgi:hypothetical protein